MLIVDRNGKVMWNSVSNKNLPSMTLIEDYNQINEFEIYPNSFNLARDLYKKEALGIQYKKQKSISK